MTPFLSIVLTGRNDDHGRNFRARFFRALDFNLRELRARGVCFEVVLVEWAPPPDRPLLASLVAREVAAAAGAPLTTYVVDPAYQEALSLNPRLQYLEYPAKNVGIRRATGEFVLATNCDVLLGRHVLDVFARKALAPRTIYRAPRYDLQPEVIPERPAWSDVEDPRRLHSVPPVLKPPLFAGGTGDFVLADRGAFHELRGFNEVYRGVRFGIDPNFLVKALSAGVPIVDIGGPVYHINHEDSYRLNRQTYAGREADAPWGNVRWHSRHVVYANPEDWGLAGAPETAIDAATRRLEFSWAAVPPLVDLRRVVLPVARRTEGAVRDVPQSQDS